ESKIITRSGNGATPRQFLGGRPMLNILSRQRRRPMPTMKARCRYVITQSMKQGYDEEVDIVDSAILANAPDVIANVTQYVTSGPSQMAGKADSKPYRLYENVAVLGN